jgi:integrase
MATRINDTLVKKLDPPAAGNRIFYDDEIGGFGVRITAAGAKSFVLNYRAAGRERRLTIGRYPVWSVERARKEAKDIRRKIDQGADPLAKPDAQAAPETFKSVSEAFIARHVEKNELRSAAEVRRIFKVYIWPEWQDTAFLEIRRKAVTDLIDKVEDGKAGESGDFGGPVMADRVLSTLSRLFSWYANRDEDYTSPVIRGMRRTKPKERARKRVVGANPDKTPNDGELRLFWRVADDAGAYGAFLQSCILTGQRRAKVMLMHRDAIDGDGGWTIAAEAREKNNAGRLLLPTMALDIIAAQPEADGNPYVFAGRDGAPLYPGDKLKKDFDAKLAEANGCKPIPHWTIHDLRRTAKTLMRRAGVDSDISERVLGHAIDGVEGVYDQYDYGPEKADALRKLAGLLQTIINPAPNVVAMREGAA